MNIYLNILKTFIENEEVYKKYRPYVNEVYLKDNLPDIYKLYVCLDSVRNSTTSTESLQYYSCDSFELDFARLYPRVENKEITRRLFSELRSSTANESSVREYLEAARRREVAVDLARKSLEFGEGNGSLEEIQTVYNVLTTGVQIGGSTSEDASEGDFVSDDLLDLSSTNQLGLRWRLDSLNVRLGSLRLGDFGFLFARPERGKTTFLSSEVTFMAGQLQPDDIIIWFNNEEQSRKVMKRCYQAALGKTLTELTLDTAKSVQEYTTVTGNRIKISRECNTKSGIESMCLKYRPKLIIFDQIDKITGFDAERYDLKMKSIYEWARNLAKVYGPVIGVCQAGGTADGKKYLTMNDVDSSHTAKQGEADWMLGIGATYESGLEQMRYMSLCKNKLEGDPDSKEELRHDQWVTRIQPTIARYEDI